MAAYGVLDDVKNLTTTVGDKVDSKLKSSLTDTDTSTTTATASKSDGQIVSDVKDIVLPTTSEILWGIVDGSIGSTIWLSLTSSTGSLASYLLNLAADNTSGAVSSVLSWVAKGAAYSCYVDGKAGWYDSLGCAAGGKIRVLIAVKND